MAGTGLKYTLKSVCRSQRWSHQNSAGYYYAGNDKAYKAYNYKAQGSKNGHRKGGVQAKQAYIVVGMGASTGIGHAARAAAKAAVIGAGKTAFKHHSRLLS